MKLIMCFLLLSTFAFAEETKLNEKQQARMDAIMKLGAPGAEHELLKKMEGKWKAQTKVWSKEGAEPLQSEGTSENKMVLDGRFLSQEFESTHMGKPFTGRSLMGYDNTKKQWVSTWADSMVTSIMISYGSPSKDKNSITLTGEYEDPITKKKSKMRMVTRIESDSRHVYEMWHKDAKGKEFKSMEIVYEKQ